MLTIKYQTMFKKDYKWVKKRGYDTKLLEKVIGLLAARQKLPTECKDHSLSGEYKGCRECHIAPDWLLIYEIFEDELYLDRTGTHADLFRE